MSEREWLLNVGIGTGAQTLQAAGERLFGREHDDGYVARLNALLQSARHFQTVHLGHHHVSHDEVDVLFVRFVQSLHTILCTYYIVVFLQSLGHHGEHLLVVFDDENRGSASHDLERHFRRGAVGSDIRCLFLDRWLRRFCC